MRPRLWFLTAAICLFLGPQVAHAAAAGTPSVCPSTLPDASIVSARPGAATDLVPAGATGITLCRFETLHSFTFVLTGYGTVTQAATISTAAAGLNSLQPYPTNPPPYSFVGCAPAPGRYVIAFFTYPSGPADPVSMEVANCGLATNGQNERYDLGSSVPLQLFNLAATDVGTATPPAAKPKTATIAGVSLFCDVHFHPRCSPHRIVRARSDGAPGLIDRVSVRSGGRVVARTMASFKGHFQLKVAPGRYVVTIGDGDSIAQRAHVVARAGKTAKVTFRFVSRR